MTTTESIDGMASLFFSFEEELQSFALWKEFPILG